MEKELVSERWDRGGRDVTQSGIGELPLVNQRWPGRLGMSQRQCVEAGFLGVQ